MNDRREDLHPPSSRRSAATYRHGKSQDEFQTELESAVIGKGIRDGPERSKRLASKLVIVPSGVPH
jgi:hypothetical protein